MIGKKLPNVVFKTRICDDNLGGDNPFRWEDKATSDYFDDKRVVLFSLPGAFTPTCSTFQLPDFEFFSQTSKLPVLMRFTAYR